MVNCSVNAKSSTLIDLNSEKKKSLVKVKIQVEVFRKQ